MLETFPNYTPSKILSSEVSFVTNEANFGDGYIQVSNRGINNQKITYPLVWNNRKDIIINEIERFLMRHGNGQPFFWTPPNTQFDDNGLLINASQVKVRMVGSLKKSLISDIGTIEATFEVLNIL